MALRPVLPAVGIAGRAAAQAGAWLQNVGVRPVQRERIVMMQVQATQGRRLIAHCRWAVIPGWEKYEASDQGDVRRIETGLVLSPSITYNGYASLRLSVGGKAKTLYVHRLVLLAFVGPPSGSPHTRHLDGNGLNNALSNLRYGTAQENADDRRLHGTVLCGDSHPLATVSDAEVLGAIERAKRTSLTKEAQRIGVAPSTLSMIRRGVNRPHLAALLS